MAFVLLHLGGVSWSEVEAATFGAISATCRPADLPWTGIYDAEVCDG